MTSKVLTPLAVIGALLLTGYGLVVLKQSMSAARLVKPPQVHSFIEMQELACDGRGARNTAVWADCLEVRVINDMRGSNR